MPSPSVEERAKSLFEAAGPSEPLPPEQLTAVWRKTEPKLTTSTPWPARLVKLLMTGTLLGGLWLTWPQTPRETVQPEPPKGVAKAIAKPAAPEGELRENADSRESLHPLAETRRSPRAPVQPAPPGNFMSKDTEVEDPMIAEARLVCRRVNARKRCLCSSR